MELLARHFESHPTASPAHQNLSPLITSLGSVPFSGRIGEKNSGQCDSDLDERLEGAFLKTPGVAHAELSMPDVAKEFDFAIRYKNANVVVEVEKANWEKVLYDFLKAHIYFASGADYVIIFVPKNYVHSGKSPTPSFQKARLRYDQCLSFGFGSPENLGRILLVGYEQALSDGRPYTPLLRKEFITAARTAMTGQREI